MSNRLLTYERFNDPEQAAEVASQLKQAGIHSTIVEEDLSFDVTFANNGFASTIHLKLLPEDFVRARQVLETFYQSQLTHLPTDYYLFSFTDAELLDLVKHPDEWGTLDYALAKQLLSERGTTITQAEEANFHEARLNELKTSESTPRAWVYFGYLLAIGGSLLGGILGYILAYLKKTLPNGEQVFVYAPAERKHGKRILILSAIFLPYWLWRLMSGDHSMIPSMGHL